MFFSLNPLSFHSPQKCTLPNGTTVFYGNDGLDCSCLAPIHADPDFAGPGLIASFTFICWLTIVVAAVPTAYALWKTWLATKSLGVSRRRRLRVFFVRALSFERAEPDIPSVTQTGAAGTMSGSRKRGASQRETRRLSRNGQVDGRATAESIRTVSAESDMGSIPKPDRESEHQQSELPSSRLPIIRGPEPLWCIFSRRIVLQLCDLQIVTGIAILVSALAQIQHLTFYHAQFATQFWWMTLNSFWVSRIDYSRDTPEMRTHRAGARRLSIWVSVLLSCVAQALVAYREYALWDPTISGRCYVADGAGTGFGQNVFWLAGTAIYFFVLSFSLWGRSRRWFDRQVGSKLEPSLTAMGLWMTEAWREARDHGDDGNAAKRSIFAKTAEYIRAGAYALAFATWWLTVLFLSIWCAGNSAALIELVVYSIFAGFLTWWILFLKIQNLVLIRGDETRFTLGQTLPLFLLVLVAIHALDVWAGVKRDDARRKARGLRAGEEPEGAVESATTAAMAVTRPIEGAVPSPLVTPNPEKDGKFFDPEPDLEKGKRLSGNGNDRLRVQSLKLGVRMNALNEKEKDLR